MYTKEETIWLTKRNAWSSVQIVWSSFRLEEHLLICRWLCPASGVGCPYEGTKEEVNDHLVTCSYYTRSTVLLRVDLLERQIQQQMSNFQERVRQVQQQVQLHEKPS
eukprot:TRINITY_DN19795_c0_g1_i1.p2 TRINITY_DN19795_c0_g1~~TRINITY_DN19795_c0_g1_i1.p2  ORF type:complete len:107 (+),score=22.57 TRINITY_DN19795_c0_g1_i1:369-689(+)